MNLQNLIDYLQNKENLSELESVTLKAITDNTFLQRFNQLKYIENMQNLAGVVNSPQGNDSPDNANYQNLLVQISNTYLSYLYDSKGKYISIKKELSALEDRINVQNENLNRIENLEKLLSGEKVLTIYAKEFKKRAKAYYRTARKWQRWLQASYFVVAFVVIVSFTTPLVDTGFIKSILTPELIPYMQIALLLFKALLILGAVQLSRFYAKNYNANMHLYQQTLHKHDVLRSLKGVYLTISEENRQYRDELIKNAAVIAFQNIESGYLTVKEGAGDADAHTSSILNSIFRSRQ